jgi:hypothetical protein
MSRLNDKLSQLDNSVQGQAVRWIREMEKPRGLRIGDLKSKDWLRELEQAIVYGLPYLLQVSSFDFWFVHLTFI